MVTKTGTAADDSLAGTDSADLLLGAGGSDTLSGGKGDDVLAGYFQNGTDPDADTLSGGEDRDTLHVGRDDRAFGDADDDTFLVFGSYAPTLLDGGSGTDTLFLNGKDITGAELRNLERLRVSDFSGGRLTADQLGQFERILPLAGKTTAVLQLSGGGNAVINPHDSLEILSIVGSGEAESLVMAGGSTTRLVFLGLETTGISSVTGAGGDDQLQGSYGVDVLDGGNGDDELAGYRINGGGAYDADRLYGRAGADTLYVGVGDIAEGGSDDDLFLIQTSFAPALLDGGDDLDTVRLGRHNTLDEANGYPAATLRNLERLEADSTAGARLTAAQLGQFDILAPFTGSTAVHLILGGGGTAEINPDASLATLTIISSSENESLTLASDSETRLIYTGTSNVGAIGTILAARGDDRLEGGDGDDLLDGGAGDDVLAGTSFTSVGPDADRLFGRSGRDILYVGRGDSAHGGADDDIFLIQGSFSPALLDGGAGVVDVVRLDPGESIAGATLVDLERLEVTGNSGGGRLTAAQLGFFDLVAPLAGSTIAAVTLASGGTARDIATDPLLRTLYINGSGEGETISLAAGSTTSLDFRGNGGDDTAFGTAAGDFLRGGSGDDALSGNLGDDLLDGGSGVDLVSFAAAAAGVEVDLAEQDEYQDTGDGIDHLISIESVRGSDFDDHLVGSAVDNRLYGDDGDDVLVGGGGGDLLSGGADADDLFGEAGDDTLVGGAGVDALVGGAGKDRLSGGFDADRFVFQSAAESAVGARRDVIVDFARGEDEIDLSGIDARTGVNGNQAFVFIATGLFAGLAGQLRYSANGVVQGDTNGDGAADFQIQVTAGLALVAADFVL